MARTSTTKPVVEEIVEKDTVDTAVNTAEEMNEKDKKNTKKSINKEPLKDSDEIEVVSLIPKVSYKDRKTLDMYEWDEVDHVELMTFETLKDMWRNDKGYFKNLWLKPRDERVINKFGLTKTFEKYEFLMDESNYNKKNIAEICSIISSTPNGLKHSICNKIKDMVINGQITDVSVVRKLEKFFDFDLIDFLD